MFSLYLSSMQIYIPYNRCKVVRLLVDVMIANYIKTTLTINNSNILLWDQSGIGSESANPILLVSPWSIVISYENMKTRLDAEDSDSGLVHLCYSQRL